MHEDLNDRQRAYLEALYEADQNAEKWNRGAWSRGEPRQPAAVFRRIHYDNGPLGSQTELQLALARQGLYDSGAGSTWSALERRGLLKVYHYHAQTILGPVPCVDVEITPKGRKLVRAKLGKEARKQLPPGTLQEWHWKALAMAYGAGETGVAATGGGWGHIGWNTWERLQRYKVGVLVEEVHPDDWSDFIRITSFGREFYRREHARYQELYPDVDAPAPAADGEDGGSPGRDEPC